MPPRRIPIEPVHVDHIRIKHEIVTKWFPDLTDQNTKEEIRELVYQKGKFDLNRSVLEEIQNKKFDDAKFKEMAGYSKEYLTINSIKDNDRFEANSVKILYSLPLNSYTLVNDKENKIYLVKLINSKKNTFNWTWYFELSNWS